MSRRPDSVVSLPGICEVEEFPAEGAPGAAPRLLVEVPHGAVRAQDFQQVRRRLKGDLPDELQDFFFVNTDVGAPECARALGQGLSRRAAGAELQRILDAGASGDATDTAEAARIGVLTVRSLVPRTFIDCNRALDAADADYAATGVTPALPSYVDAAADGATLESMWRAYHRVADAAYQWICGAGGLALTLHTYAPRAVRLERLDRGIVAALQAAYAPDTYERWPLRPEVDLITRTEDDRELAPRGLPTRVAGLYARIGVRCGQNESYRLHPSTMGYHFATRYPGQVLCVEIRRDLLADPFTPFAEMHVPEARARRLSAPLAQALIQRIAPPADS